MSDIFQVTTDYLLKGIESTSKDEKKLDGRIFTAVATMINFIGIILSIVVWKEKQNSISVALGLSLLALGTIIFVIGQFVGSNEKEAKKWFWQINVWFLVLIPLTCVHGIGLDIFFNFKWFISPLPEPELPPSLYFIYWVAYISICSFIDFIIMQKSKKEQ